MRFSDLYLFQVNCKLLSCAGNCFVLQDMDLNDMSGGSDESDSEAEEPQPSTSKQKRKRPKVSIEYEIETEPNTSKKQLTS